MARNKKIWANIHRISESKPGKLVVPPPAATRSISPSRGVVILRNGLEVPMVEEERKRWGKEKWPRFLTAAEMKWQAALPEEARDDVPY